jgi:hypothetical protein
MSYALAYQRTARLGRVGCVDAVSCAIEAGEQLFLAFKQQSANNNFKVLATAKAESFVKSMYGLAPDCTLPPPGLPIVPGGTHFCSNSIAGMIERCNLAQAQQYLGWLTQQMQQLAQQDPHYFGQWFTVYGIHDIPYLQSKIVEATALCAGMAAQSPSPTGTSLTNPGAALGGISTTTLLLIGGAFLLVFALAS